MVVTKDELDEALVAHRAELIQTWVKEIDAIMKSEYKLDPVTIPFSKLSSLLLNERELALARHEVALLYRIEGHWNVIETGHPHQGPVLIIG
jgi:hypothetical protein